MLTVSSVSYVLTNINRTQAAEIDLDLQTRPSEGPTRLPCEFVANPFSGSRHISYTNKKVTDSAKKQNLTQFTACGNNDLFILTPVRTAPLCSPCKRSFTVSALGMCNTKYRLVFNFDSCDCRYVITSANFGEDRLRGLGVAGVKIALLH